jgi:hypothetical protein
VTVVRTKFFIFLMLLLYWFFYEHINYIEYLKSQFEWLKYLYFIVKAALPFLILGIVGLPYKLNKNCKSYILLFLLFLFWAGLVTIIYGDLLEWLKLLPRFVYFIALVSFIQKYSPLWFCKTIVIFVLTICFFYIIGCTLILTHIWEDPSLQYHRYAFVNYTLLGIFNVTSRVNEYPFIPLWGFWNEPSSASAIIFSSFFFARYLWKVEGKACWLYSSWLVLIAGFFTFSMAGRIAFAAACLASIVRNLQKNTTTFQLVNNVFMILLLSIFVFCRPLAVVLKIENDLVLAITGAYKVDMTPEKTMDNEFAYSIDGVNIKNEANSMTNGRYALFKQALRTVFIYPFGIGVQNVVGKARGTALGVSSPINDISATAPVFWLVLTGFLGGVLIMWREYIVARVGWLSSFVCEKKFLLFQSYIVICVQNLSYGTWMTASYFLAVAMVLVDNYPKTLQVKD